MDSVGVKLLAPALMLAGCAATAPAEFDRTLDSTEPCRQDLRVTDLLERYPGVHVFRHGGDFQVRIRGSLQEPLYVLDGSPLTSRAGGVFSLVNPCEIDAIRVLTDPAQTFILRGAWRKRRSSDHDETA
jgi:hypothetical protein